MPLYREGTLQIIEGSKEVEGFGTEWIKESPPGTVLYADGNFYEVLSTESDTELVLTEDALTTYTGPYVMLVAVSNAAQLYLSRKIEEFLRDRQKSLVEFTDWISGDPEGGPANDGYYPITDRYGVTTYVRSAKGIEIDAAALRSIAGSVEDFLAAVAAVEAAAQSAQQSAVDAANAASSVGDASGYAQDALDAANTSTSKALEAKGYAEDAQTQADLAQGYANVATQAEGFAGQAQQHAEDALGYKTQAENLAGTAGTHAGQASEFATTAQGHADAAEGYLDTIQGLYDDAVTAKVDAEAAASAALDHRDAAEQHKLSAAASVISAGHVLDNVIGEAERAEAASNDAKNYLQQVKNMFGKVKLDPVMRHSSTKLSEDQLEVTFDGVTQAVAMGNMEIPAGKWYFEVEFVSGDSGPDVSLGLCARNEPLTNRVGYMASNNAVGLYQHSGRVYAGSNVIQASSNNYPNVGTIVRVAYDTELRQVWFTVSNLWWNGLGTANPATGEGGVEIPGDLPLVVAASSNVANVFRFNFGEVDEFDQPVPEGFEPMYRMGARDSLAFATFADDPNKEVGWVLTWDGAGFIPAPLPVPDPEDP